MYTCAHLYILCITKYTLLCMLLTSSNLYKFLYIISMSNPSIYLYVYYCVHNYIYMYSYFNNPYYILSIIMSPSHSCITIINIQYLLTQLFLPSFINTIPPYKYWIWLIDYLVLYLINNKVNCFIKFDQND